MGSCEIRFGQKQDYHVLNPLPSLFAIQLAETKEKVKCKNAIHGVWLWSELV